MRVVGSAAVHGERVMFGAHVVDRYRERVRPGLSFPKARQELLNRLPEGRLRFERPDGIQPGNLRDEILTEAWLTFESAGKAVVLPLVPWPKGRLAPTCLVGAAA